MKVIKPVVVVIGIDDYEYGPDLDRVIGERMAPHMIPDPDCDDVIECPCRQNTLEGAARIVAERIFRSGLTLNRRNMTLLQRMVAGQEGAPESTCPLCSGTGWIHGHPDRPYVSWEYLYSAVNDAFDIMFDDNMLEQNERILGPSHQAIDSVVDTRSDGCNGLNALLKSCHYALDRTSERLPPYAIRDRYRYLVFLYVKTIKEA